MGNSCQCLGGDSQFPPSGRHKSGGDHGSGHEPDTGEDARYRKTATSSKYAVPAADSDVNKNTKTTTSIKVQEDPELNLELRVPSPTSNKDDQGQTTAAPPDDSSENQATRGNPSQNQDSAVEVTINRGSPIAETVSTLATTAVETHVETFQAPSLTAQAPSLTADSPPRGGVGVDTHVEVFSLTVHDDATTGSHDSPPHAMAAADTVHINFTDYLMKDKSPSPRPGQSVSMHSSPASAGKSTSPAGVTVHVEHHHAVTSDPGVDNPVFTEPHDDPPATVAVINLSPHAASPLSDLSSSGVSNEAFDMSDEDGHRENPSEGTTHNDSNTSGTEQQWGKSYDEFETDRTVQLTVSAGTVAVAAAVEDDDARPSPTLEPHRFFFGMESLQFSARKPSDFAGVQADMEVAEMMSELDTIEDGIWIKLSAPVDVTDSSQDPESGQLYGEILDNLRDVCGKVEDILSRRGLGDDVEFDDSWINLPALLDIDNRYKSSSASVQTETAQRLLRAAADNDEENARAILDDFKKQQEKLLRMRESERCAMAKRLQYKLASRSNRSYDEANDDDAELIRSQYGDLIKADNPVENDNDYISSSSSETVEFSDDMESSSDDDTAHFTEEEVEATRTLKQTLTKDIRSNMADMSSDDFQSIMSLYRQERQTLRNIRESERGKYTTSLWDKLAERRRHVDASIHDGITEEEQVTVTGQVSISLDAITETDHAIVTETGVDPVPALDLQIKVDHTNSTKTTQEQSVAVNEKDLDQMASDTLTETFSKRSRTSVGQDELDEILQDHFGRVRKLKEQRDAESKKHRLRLLEKLSKVNSKGAEVENVVAEEITQKEEAFREEELRSEQECLVKLRQHETVSEDALRSVLEEYKENQQSLEKRRALERQEADKRLQDKLQAVSRIKADRRAAQQEEQIKSLDDSFYHSLVSKQREGDLTPDQVTQLIEEHLDLIDEYKKEVREQLRKRRLERMAKVKSSDVQAVVEQERQTTEQVRRLRKQEKDRLDDRLEEKLRKRKEQHQIPVSEL